MRIVPIVIHIFLAVALPVLSKAADAGSPISTPAVDAFFSEATPSNPIFIPLQAIVLDEGETSAVINISKPLETDSIFVDHDGGKTSRHTKTRRMISKILRLPMSIADTFFNEGDALLAKVCANPSKYNTREIVGTSVEINKSGQISIYLCRDLDGLGLAQYDVEIPTTAPSDLPPVTTTLSRDASSGQSCDSQSNEEGEVCLDPGVSMTPLSGSQLGGSVIRIEKLTSVFLETDLVCCCRFEANGFDEITEGIQLTMSSFECVTPFAGSSGDVDVSYTVNRDDCNFTSKDYVDWKKVKESFYYREDQGSVKVRGRVKSNDEETYYDAVVPTIIDLDTPFSVGWSARALLLEAILRLSKSPPIITSPDNFKVDVEVLIRNDNAVSKTDPTFQIIKTKTKTMSSTTTNATDLTVTNADIKSYLTNDWGVVGQRSASFIVRVVAYTHTDEGFRRIGATRTSQLVGVVESSGASGACIVTPKNSCQNTDEVRSCPPTRAVLLNDVLFEDDDEFCTWPSGNHECDPNYEINLDLVTLLQSTCRATHTKQNPLYGKYCDGVSTDFTAYDGAPLNGCSCKIFHTEATGCYRNGQTQCCYSKEGDLLTLPENGAGTFKCYPGDSSNFQNTMRHYLYDTLPYLYCHEIKEDSASYYEERPVITSVDYQTPTTAPVFAYGDPHFRSWHKKYFTYNGIDEHVAVCGKLAPTAGTVEPLKTKELLDLCHPSVESIGRKDVFAVHYQFAQREENDRATIINMVGIVDAYYNEEIFVVKKNNASPNDKLSLFINGVKVEFRRINDKRGKINLDNGGFAIISENESEIRIKLKHGSIRQPILIVVNNVGGTLETKIKLTDELKKGRIIGLHGRPQQHENIANEFVNSFGKELTEQEISSESRLYYDFGQTWKVDNESNSLFKDMASRSHSNGYKPIFETKFTDKNLEGEAEVTCQSIEQTFIMEACLFDISVTKDPDLVKIIADRASKEYRLTVETLENAQDHDVAMVG